MPDGRCFSITFPEDTSVTFPGGQPFQLAPLSETGLGITFPPNTSVSFPGPKRPAITLRGHFVVRLRRAQIPVSPHPTDT